MLIDDHVVTARVGRAGRFLLSDSELITLAVAPGVAGLSLRTPLDLSRPQQPPVACPVPSLPDQSGYHKRLKTPTRCYARRSSPLASCCPSWFDDLWIHRSCDHRPARGRGGGPESAQHEWTKLRLTRIAEKLG